MQHSSASALNRVATSNLSKSYGVFAPVQPQFKRALDVLLSSILLIIAAPLMAAIAVLIKLDSAGPIFYSQVRIGWNRRKSHRRYDPSVSGRPGDYNRRKNSLSGRPFNILKFRSMSQNAEKGKAQWCQVNDPRITRVGALLRKTHLDELPQLINVLRGDMSLVGPRPERPEFVQKLKEIIPDYEMRLLVKPGITGLAQVRHRSDLDIDDVRIKIKYDLLYLRNLSIGSDLGILLRTFPMALGFTYKSSKWTRTRLFRMALKPIAAFAYFFYN